MIKTGVGLANAATSAATLATTPATPASLTGHQLLKVTDPSLAQREQLPPTTLIPMQQREEIRHSTLFAANADPAYDQLLELAESALKSEDPATAGNLFRDLADRLEAPSSSSPSPLYRELADGEQVRASALLSAAHAFAKSADPRSAAPFFRRGLDALMTPSSEPGSSLRIFQTLPSGNDQVIGAFIGAASLAERLEEPDLEHLTKTINAFQSHHLHEIAPLLEGVLLSSVAGRQPVPQREVLDKALAKFDEAFAANENKAEIPALEIAWRARLLTLEVLVQRLLLAHESRRFDLRKQTRAQIYNSLRDLSKVLASIKDAEPPIESTADTADLADASGSPYRVPFSGDGRTNPDWLQERINHSAAQIADVARVLMQQKLRKPALRVARMLLDSPLYASSPSIEELKNDPLFKQYVELDTLHAPNATGSSFPHVTDRVKTAIVHQHTNSIGESVAVGSAGATIAAGMDYFLTGNTSTVMALAGVMAAGMVARVANGMRSEESRSAGAIGNPDLTWKECAEATGKLIYDQALVALALLIPIAIIATGKEGMDTLKTLASRTIDTYGGVFANLYDGVTHFFSTPHTTNLSNIVSSVANDPARTAMRIYGAGSALIFTAYLTSPILRLTNERGKRWATKLEEKSKKLAPWFFPGALFMFADIGSAVSGKDDFGFRLIRSGLVSVEMFAAMLASGVVAAKIKKKQEARAEMASGSEPARTSIAPAKKFSEKAADLWTFVAGQVRDQKYNYVTAGIYAQLINTLVGGKIQGNPTFDTSSFSAFVSSMNPETAALAVFQGWLITLGLLPLAILTSGLPKQNISLLSRTAEGLEDARKAGGNIVRQGWEAFRGGVDAIADASYVRNRTFRIPTIDTMPAFFRAVLGWDTAAGHMTFTVLTAFIFGPYANAVWPEMAGTGWERDSKALKKATKDLASSLLKDNREAIEKAKATGKKPPEVLTPAAALADARQTFDQFFAKTTQNLSLWHLGMGFRSKLDRLAPFASIRRTVNFPTFPQGPGLRTFANAYQLFMDEHNDFHLSPAVLEQFFDAVKRHAVNPQTYHVSRWWAMTLAMARDSKAHGARIERFFDENPHLVTLLDLDLNDLKTSDSPYRRVRRKEVRKKISAAMPSDRLQEAARAYGAPPIGLLMSDRFHGPAYHTHDRLEWQQAVAPESGADALSDLIIEVDTPQTPSAVRVSPSASGTIKVRAPEKIDVVVEEESGSAEVISMSGRQGRS